MLAFALSASAGPGDKVDCPTASENGQRARDKNHYIEAKELFSACSNKSCPAIVRKDCTKWRAELEDAMPTVVFAAQDARGADVADVTIEIDGRVLATRLNGSPVPVDPGEHVLHAKAAGEPPYEQKLIFRVNEKNRIVRVNFGTPEAKTASPAPAPAPPVEPSVSSTTTIPPPESARGIPTASWVLGGVGLVGLGGFVYFGLTAKTDLSQLRTSCAPYCAESDLDEVKSRMLIGDIALGVGVVALGVAAILAITHR